MNEHVENGYVEYRPTRRERFWRAMGFVYHRGEDPEGTDGMRGWIVTTTRMNFNWRDRLRLLLTGRLRINMTQHLPAKCDYALTRLDWFIVPPGDKS